jgi:hypothetical protein
MPVSCFALVQVYARKVYPTYFSDRSPYYITPGELFCEACICSCQGGEVWSEQHTLSWHKHPP